MSQSSWREREIFFLRDLLPLITVDNVEVNFMPVSREIRKLYCFNSLKKVWESLSGDAKEDMHNLYFSSNFDMFNVFFPLELLVVILVQEEVLCQHDTISSWCVRYRPLVVFLRYRCLKREKMTWLTVIFFI